MDKPIIKDITLPKPRGNNNSCYTGANNNNACGTGK